MASIEERRYEWLGLLPPPLRTRRGIQLVDWIASNDNDGNGDGLEEVASYITVTMLAHTYNVRRAAIARAIMAHPNRAL